jgi:hypothetical protein
MCSVATTEMVAGMVSMGKIDGRCDFGHMAAGKDAQRRFDVELAAVATGWIGP